MPIQRGAATPIKMQLVDDLRRRITAGEWPLGGKVPSLRQLATEYEVAAQTITDAMAVLQRGGLIETVVGRGTFVRAMPDTEASDDLRAEVVSLRSEVAELRERVAVIEEREG